MNVSELIVELTLTGLLMLFALLLPLWGGGFFQFELSAEALALGVAFALALGVILDRCADSILSHAESVQRLKFASDPQRLKQRGFVLQAAGEELDTSCEAIAESGGDPFPEDWLRLQVLTQQGGILKRVERLRVRIRVSRALVVLVPLLTVSTATALFLSAHADALESIVLIGISFGVPGTHLAGLLIVSLLGKSREKLKTFDPTAWQRFEGYKPRSRHVFEGYTLCWALGNFAFLIVVLAVLSMDLGGIPIVTTLGGVLILLAGGVTAFVSAEVWMRLHKTFFGLQWDFCIHQDPLGLAAVIQGKLARPMSDSSASIPLDAK